MFLFDMLINDFIDGVFFGFFCFYGNLGMNSELILLVKCIGGIYFNDSFGSLFWGWCNISWFVVSCVLVIVVVCWYKKRYENY